MRLYRDAGRWEDVEVLLLDLEPDESRMDFGSLRQLADARFRLGREPEAEETLERAIALDPELASALHAKANALLTQYNWIEAEKWFERAIAADPDSTEIMEDGAGFLRYTWQMDRAKAVVDRMIMLDPFVAIFLWQGVNIYHQLGDIEQRENRIRELEAQLADPDVYQDGDKSKQLVSEFELLRSETESLWQRLEELSGEDR